MSSLWTPSIEEKSSLSRSMIKHETTDHEEHEDENSNLSNGTGTSSSSSSAPGRTSPNNRSAEQHRNSSNTINHLYSEASASTPVTNTNTVTSNDLPIEQYPSTHGWLSERRRCSFTSATDVLLSGSSPFPGQFIRADAQSASLSYTETVGYYTEELANGVDPLQQQQQPAHHHSQNYSHLQQRKRD